MTDFTPTTAPAETHDPVVVDASHGIEGVDPRLESVEKFHQYMQSMLPDEEREKFQRIGERLYNSFDVHKGQVLPNQGADSIRLEESLAYVVESMKSGLHPKYLTEDEIHLLRAGYGDEWYTKWGYAKEDVEA